MTAWTRMVSLGDSFTEGLHDGDDDALVGWADRLAVHLDRRQPDGPPLEYANLAIRGRLLGQIIEEQLPRALELEPDLVTLCGGGNDLLRPGADPDALAALLEAAVVDLRGRGIDVLVQTLVDPKDSPVIRLQRARYGVFNTSVWSLAQRHGAHVLDLWGMRSLRDWRMWSSDRIHLTPEGHARVAQGALVALHLDPDTPDWDDPLAPLPHPPRVEWLRANARWAREHGLPWVRRRLRGESSGDGRLPKRPLPLPVR